MPTSGEQSKLALAEAEMRKALARLTQAHTEYLNLAAWWLRLVKKDYADTRAAAKMQRKSHAN